MVARPLLRLLLTMLASLACLIESSVSSHAMPSETKVYGNSLQATRWAREEWGGAGINCLRQTRDGYLWIGTDSGLVRFDGLRFKVFNRSNTSELSTDIINVLAEDTEGTLWIGTDLGLGSYRDHVFHWLPNEELPDSQVKWMAPAQSGGIWLEVGDQNLDWVARLDGGRFSRFWSTKGKGVTLSEDPGGWLNFFTDSRWSAVSPTGDSMRTNPIPEFWETNWLEKQHGQHAAPGWAGIGNQLQHLTEHTGTGKLSYDFIFQDRFKQVWISMTSDGDDYLARWDGDNWDKIGLHEYKLGLRDFYTLIDSSGLRDGLKQNFRHSGLFHSCLEVGLDGSLWTPSEVGLDHIEQPLVRTYTVRDGLPGSANSVCEGTDGTIWVTTPHGLGSVRNGRVEMVSTDGGINFAGSVLWPARSGGIWIAFYDGRVCTFRDNKLTNWTHGKSFSGIPTAMFEDGDGRLWLATSEQLIAFRDGQVIPCREDAEDSKSVGGNPSRHKLSYPKQATELKGVACISEDRLGSLWFATRGHGLARLRAGELSFFTTHDGVPGNVRSIYEDTNGALWLGTDEGLAIYRNGKFFAFDTEGLPRADFDFPLRVHVSEALPNAIDCVLEDDSGFLWFVCKRLMFRVEKAQLEAVADGRSQKFQAAVLDEAAGINSALNQGSQPVGWKAHDGRLWFRAKDGVAVIDPRAAPTKEVLPAIIEQVTADGRIVFGDGYVEEPAKERKIDSPPSVASIPAGNAQDLEFQYTDVSYSEPRRTRFRYRLIGGNADWCEETSERTAHYSNLRPGTYRFEVLARNYLGIRSSESATFAFTIAPSFWQTKSFYAICACSSIGLTGLQIYRLRWRRRLSKVAEQRAVANERTRIARDLHDDLGTALTGLALELDVIGLQSGEPAPVGERLNKSAQRVRDLASRMREVVWTVNPDCDTVSSLASFLEQQVEQFLRVTNIKVRLEFPEDIPAIPLSATARVHLSLAVREALTNVVRHARATEAVVGLEIVDHQLVVRVRDNGCGFQTTKEGGFGLKNLQTRLEDIGGGFECISKPGEGTTITFRLPLEAGKGGT